MESEKAIHVIFARREDDRISQPHIRGELHVIGEFPDGRLAVKEKGRWCKMNNHYRKYIKQSLMVVRLRPIAEGDSFLQGCGDYERYNGQVMATLEEFPWSRDNEKALRRLCNG